MEYNYKYATERFAQIEGVPSEEVDDCFRVLLDVFGKDWLDQESNNVVQRLWKAKYHLATQELYALGFALRKLQSIDQKFIKDKVALMRSADPKDVNGAMFEVFALSSFNEHYKVSLLKKGNLDMME